MASKKRSRQRARRNLEGLTRYSDEWMDAMRDLVAIEESARTVTPTEIRGDLVDIDEAALRSDGTVPIRLISPGWGSSGYYSPQVLEAAAGDNVFPAGTHMYWDHPTLTERQDRPERSLRDLAAVTETDAVWRDDPTRGPGLYAQARVFESYREILTEMAPHIGVSIRAGAQIGTGEAEGRRGRIVERLIEGQSVDFVTKPGRGGQILAVLEANRVAEAGLWNDEVRQLLRTALLDRFPQDEGRYLWVRDWDDTDVVFDLEGSDDLEAGTYRLGYTASDDGVTLTDGEPTRVQVHTSYEPVGESRNVGEWFQSRIHLHFTTIADDMFGDGRLTKDERISLSSGIGAALDAFTQTIEQRAPQLLTRDLWDDPAATTTSESEEDPDMPITQEERAAIAAEAATAVITQLTEAGVIKPAGTGDSTDVDEAARERTEAIERAERAEGALLVENARKHVAANDKVKGLPAVARDRVIERLASEAKAGDDGKLDVAALNEAITTTVDAEVKYLAEATGSPVRGVGDGDGHDDTTDATEAEARLEGAFGRLGLSEGAAKVAVAGRAR